MMKLELKGVHVYAKIPGTATGSRLVAVNPAMRLGGVQGHLYIQAGAVFEEGGKELPLAKVPAWFHEELAKCDPAALRECGFKRPEQPAAKK